MMLRAVWRYFNAKNQRAALNVVTVNIIAMTFPQWLSNASNRLPNRHNSIIVTKTKNAAAITVQLFSVFNFIFSS